MIMVYYGGSAAMGTMDAVCHFRSCRKYMEVYNPFKAVISGRRVLLKPDTFQIS